MNPLQLHDDLLNGDTQAADRKFHALWAKAFTSLSPESAWLAFYDWAAHLASSPGKRMELAQLAQEQATQLVTYLRECLVHGPGQSRACIEPPATDRRFSEPEWRAWPFNLMHQSFLLTERWWDAATHGVWGVEKHHQDVVAFAARQFLDTLSPGNLLATNPVALKRTFEEGGANLVRGMEHLAENIGRALADAPLPGTEQFRPGHEVAATPGKVVLRTPLMELIQYAPTTGTVHPEPVLVVPAWIMKYYILDLSPQNSLIKYLVDNGHTVFCISWKNPGEAERDFGMDDYLSQGFFAALDAVCAITKKNQVHAAGYCLGGTLLSIAAAAMARDGDDRLASMTLVAAQTDFTEPGELALFIDESQVALLEAQMDDAGYLRADQMAGAFQMLRSYDLMYSRMVQEYLLGERMPMNDLMAWNADATRMPAKMHGQYLRRLFLGDDLSEGRYPVDGRPVSLGALALPCFCVGTVTDHVAPWRSVYKLHYMVPAEITFVLTSGGHNAGIVSEPGHPRRHFQMRTRAAGGEYLAPEEWVERAPRKEGSWWPEWQAWLAARSSAKVKPPRMGGKNHEPLCDAPGSYVLEK